MIENEKTGLVGGSLDRTRIKELHDQTDDAELKAYYRGLLGESEEGKSIDEDATVSEPEPEDLSKLTKAELVDRAGAAGIDTEGKTKADLVEALNNPEVSGGNDNVP